MDPDTTSEPSVAAAPVTGSTPAPAATATDSAQPTAPKTRLLKEVEAEENTLIYNALYCSLDDAADKAIKTDFSDASDIIAESRRAKAEFFAATALPLGRKAQGCGALAGRLGEARNKQVASIFFTVTMMMFTLPVLAAIVGMQVVAPRLQADATLCGGFAGVGVAVLIMIGYTLYALWEDAQRSTEDASAAKATGAATEKGADGKKNA